MNIAVRRSIVNYASDRIQALASAIGLNTNNKHDHYGDFGWPSNITFNDFHKMYRRNGLAAAAINKTKLKTWQDDPQLWETETEAETSLEADVRRWVTDLRLWHHFAEADKRSMVGGYAGLILRIADGRRFDQPVGQVSGLEGLVELIPVWRGQIKVAQWYDDPRDRENADKYGKPKMYEYTEAMPDGTNKPRQRGLKIHPDRMLIWSADGTLNCPSAIESGYNDLIDAEKVKGAGGEGFWKNSRGAPLIQAAEGLKPGDVAKAMGVDPKEMLDAINEQIENFQKGFDQGLMLGGMTATPLSINLPQPEQFFNTAAMSFAASMGIPIKILLGSQTGERASSEDAKEWNQTNESRRLNLCAPLIREFIKRMVRFGIMEERDWTVGWASLTEATPSEQMQRAKDMSQINQQHKSTLATRAPGGVAPKPGDEPGNDTQTNAQEATDMSDLVFTIDEIREVVGYKSRAKQKGARYIEPTGDGNAPSSR